MKSNRSETRRLRIAVVFLLLSLALPNAAPGSAIVIVGLAMLAGVVALKKAVAFVP